MFTLDFMGNRFTYAELCFADEVKALFVDHLNGELLQINDKCDKINNDRSMFIYSMYRILEKHNYLESRIK